MKRKIILSLATSLDGYILDKYRKFDWIKGDGDKSHDTENKFDFSKFLNTVDTIVMGRKSFEDATIESIEIFKSKKLLVATHRKLNTKYDNVEVINGDIVNIISKLKKEKGKDIWLYGGAILADQFIKKNIIDEYIIAIIPIILGGGIQLFLKNNPKIELHLNECVVQDGMVIVKYKKRK